jgi:hypothetical protein
LNSSKKAASRTPTKKKKNPVEDKKKRKTVEDKTSVGRIFNQLKRDAEKKKERSERIRRRRGVYLRRLKLKKTEEDRKAYARRYEGTFVSKEEAIVKKDKERLQRKRYELKVWREQSEQLEAKLLQQKKLLKKEEKQINDSLNLHFPEYNPPPSDDSSVVSLDSQLSSDTSDGGVYPNQSAIAKSIREGKREQKREDKQLRRTMRKENIDSAKRGQLEYDSGKELPEEVTQISKLRFIPQQTVNDWQELDFKTGELTELPRPKKRMKMAQGSGKFYPACYQSLMYNKSGKSEMGFSLSCTWVQGVFNERFLELVRGVGIREDQNKTKWSKRRWISVPVGSKMNDTPPTDLLYPSVHCRFQQNDYNTCVYKSMASVFHFAGRKDVANYLSSIAHAAGTPDLDAVTQVNRLCSEVRQRETLFRKIDYMKKEKAIARLNIYDPEPNPKLWILLARDGGTSHAVGVIGEYVFDSNVPNAMKLSKETLDWCSNCKDGFTRIHMYVRFRK